MSFAADLHIHSCYSRATARDLNLESLHYWAQLKGLTVVGTGDFTHPKWFGEIREKLEPAEPGLFVLKPEFADPVNAKVPESCRGPVRFILSAEISNIYKKNDRTRKNHNVICMPDPEKVLKFNAKLDSIGNITSDGRPILGLDARNLLEIMLEHDPEGIFIPAHIWTPWFSLLDSKSGFDSIEECFEDLSSHIFALETGLSSDPPMNWRISGLDGRTLVSNSDAHSPSKLAREANLFDTELSFPAMRRALETGENFLGTIEFFPEEGKYHLDGHRKCGICFRPGESLAHDCLCPVCGKPLTLGVLHRVEELADRQDGQLPERRHPFHSLVPLVDILSTVLGVGPTSKKVTTVYHEILKAMGPELWIIKDAAIEELEKSPLPLLGEAIKRMRAGNIVLNGGFDGEYGTVAVFDDQEREILLGQQALFSIPKPAKAVKKKPEIKKKAVEPSLIFEDTALFPDSAIAGNETMESQEPPLAPAVQKQVPVERPAPKPFELNAVQKSAVNHQGSPLLIKAGPGTGKTRTLTHRIARLIQETGALPESVLAITFTNQAAREMHHRLEKMMGEQGSRVHVATFHAFCLTLLREQAEAEGRAISVLGEKDRLHYIRQALKEAGIKKIKPEQASLHISLAKQRMVSPNFAEFQVPEGGAMAMKEAYIAYQTLIFGLGLLDFDDLMYQAVRTIEADSLYRESLQKRFPHVCVDEFQDVNQVQYRLLGLLCPPDGDLAVIGDPDQAIYGFRGSDVVFFNRFSEDYPRARIIHLSTNYRSTETVLKVAGQVMGEPGQDFGLHSGIVGADRIMILDTPTSAAESEAIVHIMESMVGGTSHFSLDSGRVELDTSDEDWSLGDFAVLFRTRLQLPPLVEALDRSGIPYQVVDKKRLVDHPGVEELLSYLRLINQTGTDLDLLRIMNVPKRGIGDKTMETLRTWGESQGKNLTQTLDVARRLPLPGLSNSQQIRLHTVWKTIADARRKTEDMPLAEALEHLIYSIPLEPLYARSGNGRTASACIVDMARDFSGGLARFCDLVNLASDADTLAPEADRVSLMTMHAAKGLEFRGVFVAGCEDGLIPHAREGKESDPEEELRLFYVALTRAQRRLWLTYAKRRRMFGMVLSQKPSPFLARIEKEMKDLKKPFKRKKKPEPVQLDLFGD
ncbi:MAG: UvrD-helicase domain-containing protein [Desulfatibacillum sp.]|nr:UvrD-helicase domain-containing protein [Desulfatibacillum sp.]